MAGDVDEAVIVGGEEDDLRSRVFRLRLAKRSATEALERWAGEGRAAPAPELRRIARDLSRAHRYKHALEVRALTDPKHALEVRALTDPKHALESYLSAIFSVHRSELLGCSASSMAIYGDSMELGAEGFTHFSTQVAASMGDVHKDDADIDTQGPARLLICDRFEPAKLIHEISFRSL